MIDTGRGVSYNANDSKADAIACLSKAEIEFWIAYHKMRERVLQTEINWHKEQRAQMEKQMAIGG